ncbi:hypothetical protein N1031_00010 [Herbiconiux moechotypicola]|uniref:hypothetical protein n=1 Tax=Herbiconiux moechotypicola TaxID=637393 RepID=UPI00217E79F4|nr:hypothetical protein [Herbiconiux moechotypicola]MCS5728133.1 hypothetical protein [Herbiconiux moechotypicola]
MKGFVPLKRALVVAAATVGLLSAPLVGAGTANAAADVLPPTFVSGSVDKKTFNLGDGPATFTVTVKASDPSGVEAPFVTAGSATTSQGAGFGQMSLVAGTAKNGTWQHTITIPATAAPGLWTVTLYPLADSLGNGTTDFKTIASVTLNAAAPADTSPPTFLGASVDKNRFNLKDGPATFTVTLKASDPSGVEAPFITAGSTTTTQGAGFGQMSLVSGTTKNGTWQRTITIPSTAAPGLWNITLYPLGDSLGNGTTEFRTIASVTLTTRPALPAGSPTITGSPVVGGQLTTKAGIWPAGTTFTYQWVADGVDVVDATSKSFTPTAATVGKKISVRVTGSLTGYDPTSVTTAPTGAVGLGTLTAGTPTIKGSAAVGASLRATAGTWTSSAALTYQWTAGGVAVPGATKSTFTPTASLLGKQVDVRVTGTLAGYTSRTTKSASTAAIAKGTLIAPTPTVGGTPKTGVALTAKTGSWTAGTKFTYAWFADSKAIAGASSSSFIPTAAQVGKKISVRVTGTLAGYTTVTRTSAQTTIVAKGTQSAAAPTIAGTPKVGTVLTVKTGGWRAGTTLRYQWIASGKAITGATKSTFTPTRAQIGHKISVTVTGSLPGYSDLSKTSAQTPIVVR